MAIRPKAIFSLLSAAKGLLCALLCSFALPPAQVCRAGFLRDVRLQ
jgi:hypothetical protein